MQASVKIKLTESLFLRDPEETALGRNLIRKSIELMDLIGYEDFTFKKLAVSMGSTEASIYRYFENKHKLLIYLVSWYWAYLSYEIDFEIHNIRNPKSRLKKIISIISDVHKTNVASGEISVQTLQKIVISESAKSYLIKDVEGINKHGAFREYKSLCKKIANLISEINPRYKYPSSVASCLLEASHQQVYFALHLPSLTDLKKDKKNHVELAQFLEHFLFNLIEK